jgi:predicted transposase YdaD
LALSAVTEAARGALEELMRRNNYEYQSEFARRFVAQGLEQGQRQGREEGLEQGRQEGRQEGLQQGREEGHLDGERRALLKVLEARGLKAVTVQSVQELFTPKPRSKPVVRAVGVRVRTHRPCVQRRGSTVGP